MALPPDRPDRVHDVVHAVRGQSEGGGGDGGPGGTPAERATCLGQLSVPGGGEDRPAHSAAGGQALVGGVDDDIGSQALLVETGDVADDDRDTWHPASLARWRSATPALWWCGVGSVRDVDPFTVRRVVTEVDAEGRAMWTSDRSAAGGGRVLEDGLGVANVWAFDAATSIGDGLDALADPFTLEPPPGGMSWRVLRLPAPDPPAWRRSSSSSTCRARRARVVCCGCTPPTPLTS